MLRRKTKRPIPATPPSSWAVLRIDNHPIRDKARKDYQKALRELDLARRQIDQFEKTDRPQFQQWLNRACGALVTELRETSGKLETKRALLFEIQSEALAADCSHAQAYERVMSRKDDPAEPTPEFDHDQAGPEQKAREKANPFSDFFNHGDPRARNGREPLSSKDKPQLKELYRALVRRLHPDTQGTMSGQRKDWWHQAQAAYESGDAEQLELLLTLCEIDDHGTTNKTSVSLLFLITRQFKSSLRTLRSRLNQYRLDPAWKFSGVQDRGPLLERAERMLRAELFEVQRALAAVEAQLESWARQARNGRPGPAHRSGFGARSGKLAY